MPLVLQPPVEAPIVRPFHYAGSPFAAGLHRGVDFGTEAGQTVRAPCAGRVAWAGTDGVTLVCAGRRVTLLPLAPAVAEGAATSPGEPLGTAGAEPLHLGVRRPADPFGYQDPERFLAEGRPSPPLVGPRRSPRPFPSMPAARPRPAPAPGTAAPAASPALAPWPAWAGLALALGGAVTGGRARRRRAARTRTVPVRAGPQGVS